MENLFTIEFDVFKIIVILVSVEVVGIVQWLKNLKRLKVKNYYKALIVTLICATMQFTFIPTYISTMFNIVACSLALTQLGWDVISDGIPAMLAKAFGLAKEQKNNDTDGILNKDSGEGNRL